MRLIDAEALMDKLYVGENCWVKGSRLRKEIEESPTIAIAHIVNEECGHCKSRSDLGFCLNCNTKKVK